MVQQQSKDLVGFCLSYSTSFIQTTALHAYSFLCCFAARSDEIPDRTVMHIFSELLRLKGPEVGSPVSQSLDQLIPLLVQADEKKWLRKLMYLLHGITLIYSHIIERPHDSPQIGIVVKFIIRNGDSLYSERHYLKGCLTSLLQYYQLPEEVDSFGVVRLLMEWQLRSKPNGKHRDFIFDRTM